MSKHANHCECGRIKPYMADGCDKCTALEHASAGRSNKRPNNPKLEQLSAHALARGCDAFLKSRGLEAARF